MQAVESHQAEPQHAELLAVRDLRFGYTLGADVIGPLSLGVDRSQVWAVLGANGAGKSTLLRLMAGLLRPRTGSIALLGQPLGEWSLRQRARRIAYLPQHAPTQIALSVRETVLLARHPFRALNFFESAEDLEVVDAALAKAGLSAFASRPLDTLSGGEARRVHLAACLAQDPLLMFLDEPTTSLDLRHQLDLLDIAVQRVRTAQGAAVVVLHDVNLARRCCTHALLLRAGRVVRIGEAGDVIEPEALEETFELPFSLASTPRGAAWLVPSDGAPGRTPG